MPTLTELLEEPTPEPTPGIVSSTISAMGDKLAPLKDVPGVKPIMSATGAVFEGLRRTLEQPITGTLRAAQEGSNPLTALKQGITGERKDTFADVMKNDPRFMPDTQRGQATPEEWAKSRETGANLTGAMESLANPVQWAVGVGGLTRTGVNALKGIEKGETVGFGAQTLTDKLTGSLPETSTGLAETLGEQANQGQRALLTIGDKPIIEGKPALNALTKVKEKMPWFDSKTGITGYDSAKEQMMKSPEAYAGFKSQGMSEEDSRIIRDHAESMGITPEELNKKVLDYIEPPGSQIGDPEMVKIQQEELGAQLPPEVKAFADEKIKLNQAFHESENAIPGRDYGARDFYEKHLATPEWQKFVKSKFSIPETQSGIAQPAKSTAIPEQMSRKLGDYTVNEINNLSQAGKLDQVFPNFPELKEFKGKMFSDDVAAVSANRYLQNAKVTSRNDFLQHVAKTYGKPTDSYLAATKSGAIKDYTQWEKVQDPALPDGEMMFPTKIAKDLKRINELSKLGPTGKKALGALRATSNFVKRLNYGMWPSSAAANYESNQVLAFLGDIFDPMAQVQAAGIVNGAKAGRFLDKPVVYSKTTGPLTDRQVWDLFHRYRAGGGGLTQADLPTPGNFLTKAGQSMQDVAENSSRMGGFIAALQKGYTPEKAARAVQDAFLDYGAMGSADELIKPFIPFYSFTRKALPNMVGKMFTHPGKFNLPQRISDITTRKEDKNDMEEWQRQGIPIFVGMKDDQPMYMLGGNIWPQAILNQFIGSGKSIGEMMKNTPQKASDNIMSMINPVITTPHELFGHGDKGYSYFSHQPIENFPGEKQSIVGDLSAPSKIAYAARKLRPFPEAQRFVDPQMPGALAVQRAISGLNIRPIDVERQRMRHEMQPSRDVKEIRNNIRMEAMQKAKADAKGDKMRSKLAQENIDILLQNLRQLGTSLEEK